MTTYADIHRRISALSIKPYTTSSMLNISSYSHEPEGCPILCPVTVHTQDNQQGLDPSLTVDTQGDHTYQALSHTPNYTYALIFHVCFTHASCAIGLGNTIVIPVSTRQCGESRLGVSAASYKEEECSSSVLPPRADI